jgi:hypothetical protein
VGQRGFRIVGGTVGAESSHPRFACGLTVNACMHMRRRIHAYEEEDTFNT